MRPILACSTLAIALALAACSPPPADQATTSTVQQAEDESARLNAWFEEQYEVFLQFSPTSLTFQGRKELNDRIDDVSDEGMRKRLDWMAASVAAMESGFDYDSLDDETRLSWDIWKRQYESARGQMEYLAHIYSFDQMNGMNSVIPTFLINFQRVD